MNISQTDSDICSLVEGEKKLKADPARIDGKLSPLNSPESKSNIPKCPSSEDCKMPSKADMTDEPEPDDEQMLSSDEPTVACNGSWEKMYGRLVDFLEKYGHCRVPYRFKEDPQLGAWVAMQRRSHKLMKTGRRKKTSLTPERRSQLEKIGFEWSVHNPHSIPWEKRFIHLLEFVSLNGHAQVPTKWEENSQLSNWVSRQRREYQKLQMGQPSVLTKDRIQLLNYIDFVWEAQRGGVKRINQNGSVAQAPCGKLDANAPSADSLRFRAKFLLRNLKDPTSSRAPDMATALQRSLMASESASASDTATSSKRDTEGVVTPMLGSTSNTLPVGKANKMEDCDSKRDAVLGVVDKALRAKWVSRAASANNNLITKRHPAENIKMGPQHLTGSNLRSFQVPSAAALDPSIQALSEVVSQSRRLPHAPMRMPSEWSANPLSERLTRLSSAEDTLARLSSAEDTLARLSSAEDSFGRLSSSAEDTLARLSSAEDTLARLSSSQDPLARLSSSQDPLARLTSSQDALLSSPQDHLARLTSSQDALARLSSAEDTLARLSSSQDPLARLSSSQDPLARLSTSQDPLARLSSSQDPLARLSSSQDPLARLSGSQDPLARLSSAEDTLARLSSAEDALVSQAQRHIPFLGSSQNPPQPNLLAYLNLLRASQERTRLRNLSDQQRNNMP